MAGRTSIEWTEWTWNPVRGCSRVSPGCERCYAERQAIRGSGPDGPFEGLVRSSAAGPRWTGEIRFLPEALLWPLGRRAESVFVNSMSDLFHEGVSAEQIRAILGVIAATPWTVFQVLTKRPERALEVLRGLDAERCIRSTLKLVGPNMKAGRLETHAARAWPLSNLWLGVSVEDQRRARERIPTLQRIPAAVRWVSAEPLLGPLELEPWLDPADDCRLDWVVAGGESGHGARPAHPGWFRRLRDQVVGAGVPFFFKQWGAWTESFSDTEGALALADSKFGPSLVVPFAPRELLVGRLLDGRVWNERPKLAGAVGATP